jgi:hypothetical protein
VAGAPADGLGNALAPAGDVNGDGAEDLLVAAYLGNRVCVLLGGVPDGESTLDALSPACLAGEGPHDYAGYALAGVGDADGDGFDDDPTTTRATPSLVSAMRTGTVSTT